MPKKGGVFAFEGPDGVGKTTLISAVEQILARARDDIIVLSFPGSTPGTLGAHVYEIHHSPRQHSIRNLVPDALQVLHVAAHIDTIESVIRPHIEGGGVALLDRYWWSTWVYGRLNGVPARALTRMISLEKMYWRDLEPHAIFLVTRPSSEISPIDRALFIQRTQEYQVLASRESLRSRVIHLENFDEPCKVGAVAGEVIRQFLSSTDPSRLGGHIGPPKTATPGGPQIPLSYDHSDCQPPPSMNDGSRALIWAKPTLPKPTSVFDTYWRFAAERQEIFFRRFHGVPMPWTEDPILRRYKFTNAYRASDRVSQYLIRNVIYAGDQNPRELFFRIVLFKLFNRIGTWARVVELVGNPCIREFEISRYDQALTTISQSGEPVYSGAYIMPSGGADWREARKHRMHLKLIEYLLSQDLPDRVAAARTMQEAFELLKNVPTFGDFLAYQYVTDLNYSTALDFSESDFVMPGPGARDGIRKCFSSLGSLTEADIIRFVCEHQEHEFRVRGITFKSLWGRPLQLIDCQNLFCELDKYAREYHPDVRGKSGRTRIKQQFRPTEGALPYWYPPKWGLNDRISAGS
jgi:thymidylate kinase